MTTPRKRPQRKYAPADRARVLAVLTANGGNISRTAREAAIPEATVRMWRDHEETAAPAELRDRARQDLAAEVDEVRWKYLERAREQKAISGTSGFYAAKVFADLTNVHQLLTGGPTQRIDATPWGQLLIAIRESREGRISERMALLQSQPAALPSGEETES